MKTKTELVKSENEITIDCKNKKVYFNGKEVVKMSFNFEDGKFLDYPYYDFLYAALVAKADNIQDYLDNHFILYAVIYKDNANKEHLVVWEYGNWNDIGSWDSIELNTNDNVVVAYGINDGKRVNRIVMEKAILFGFDTNDVNNVNRINMGYGVCCYEC